MKSEKGEAAFDSTDDVLAKRIINSTEKHGENDDASNLDSTSNYSFEAEVKPGMFRGKTILIAACAGALLLIVGILLFRCKKCCCRK